MPYGLIALFAALISSAWFVLSTEASRPSKIVVTVVCLSSVATAFLSPQLALAGLVLQALLVIGISLYAKSHLRVR